VCKFKPKASNQKKSASAKSAGSQKIAFPVKGAVTASPQAPEGAAVTAAGTPSSSSPIQHSVDLPQVSIDAHPSSSSSAALAPTSASVYPDVFEEADPGDPDKSSDYSSEQSEGEQSESDDDVEEYEPSSTIDASKVLTPDEANLLLPRDYAGTITGTVAVDIGDQDILDTPDSTSIDHKIFYKILFPEDYFRLHPGHIL